MADDSDAYVATTWFSLAGALTKRTPGFTPPVASRAFGYLGVTLYEAVSPGMPGHQSIAAQLNGLHGLPSGDAEDLHWPTVANSALAEIARHLYAASGPQAQANLADIDALEDVQASFEEIPLWLKSRSAGYGRAVAAAIFAWSQTDGGHEGQLRNFPADYVAPIGAGMWVPTAPANQTAMQPTWGMNRPFLKASTESCDPPAPLAYSEEPASRFFQDAEEVHATTRELSDEQRQIALFWSDDPGKTSTPPGHAVSIATQALEMQASTLGTAAKVYARLGIALADAFIACWRVKYQHNLLRPITFITDVIDPNWTALLATPPFPEYPSGHSVQSAAAAEVLTDSLGWMSFDDYTHIERGLEPRHYDSFFAAAEEAALSRLYGGIHFREAIERGMEQGFCLGQHVNALRFMAGGSADDPSPLTDSDPSAPAVADPQPEPEPPPEPDPQPDPDPELASDSEPDPDPQAEPEPQPAPDPPPAP